MVTGNLRQFCLNPANYGNFKVIIVKSYVVHLVQCSKISYYEKPHCPLNIQMDYIDLRACLHVPSPSPCLSPSKFIIVPMETDRLMDRIGNRTHFAVKRSVSIDTM